MAHDPLSNSIPKSAYPQLEGYQIIDVLGRGSMGVVFKAKQENLGRLVAIKAPIMPEAGHDADVDKFLKEARLIAKMGRHPNILQIHDVINREERGCYIVMEYFEGRTLEFWLKKRRRYTMRDTLKIGVHVCKGLHHAHMAGVVHRDIKPANLMLGETGEIRLMDFGIAALRDAQNNWSTGPLGTPHYMAPEQVRGEKHVDGRTDVYSLGATMYHMICGQPPFTAENPLGLAYKHVNDPVEPMSSLVRGVDPELDELIVRSMAKNPTERFTSAEDFGEQLKRFLQSRDKDWGRVIEPARKELDESKSSWTKSGTLKRPEFKSDKSESNRAVGSFAGMGGSSEVHPSFQTGEFPSLKSPADPESQPLEPISSVRSKDRNSSKSSTLLIFGAPLFVIIVAVGWLSISGDGESVAPETDKVEVAVKSPATSSPPINNPSDATPAIDLQAAATANIRVGDTLDVQLNVPDREGKDETHARASDGRPILVKGSSSLDLGREAKVRIIRVANNYLLAELLNYKDNLLRADEVVADPAPGAVVLVRLDLKDNKGRDSTHGKAGNGKILLVTEGGSASHLGRLARVEILSAHNTYYKTKLLGFIGE